MADLLGQLDVGHRGEPHAVERDRSPGRDLSQLAAVGVVFFLLALELLPDGRRRVDDDLAVRPVDDQVVAGLDRLGDVVEADDGRDVERPGQDGRMGGLAAHVQGHGQDPALAEPEGGLRGKEVVGDEDLPPDVLRPAASAVAARLRWILVRTSVTSA